MLLPGWPHWTAEEIKAWLDYDAIGDEEAYEEEVKKVSNYGFSVERGIKGLQQRIELSLAEERELYRFR